MSRFFENSDHVVDEPATAPAAPAAPAPAAPAPAAPAPIPAVPDAEPEYVQVPDNIAELRKNQFYDPAVTYREDIKFESAELPPEQIKAVSQELSRMAGDVGLSSPEVREIAQLAKANFANFPTDETQDTWRTEATNALTRQYGAKAHEALSLAQKLYQRDPRLAALLEANGLGNHPRVVAAMVQRAYAEKKAGRL